jgi:hypothetical protein
MQDLPFEPAENGFVFTIAETEAEGRRQRCLREAKIAQDCNYDRKKFQWIVS